MNYKGYISKIDFDENAEVFYGTVINSNALISFHGKNVKELKKAFIDTIDTYLETCNEEGVQPEKIYSGKFNIRISPELHQKIAIKALIDHESMNTHIEKLLTEDVKDLDANILAIK